MLRSANKLSDDRMTDFLKYMLKLLLKITLPLVRCMLIIHYFGIRFYENQILLTHFREI